MIPKWWFAFIAVIGVLILVQVARTPQRAVLPPTATVAGVSASQQWQDAFRQLQAVNNQLIAAQGAGVPNAVTLAAIDQQAQVVNATFQKLPSSPGVSDSITAQVRNSTAHWAKGIHTISTGVAARDVALILAGNDELAAGAAEINAADANLHAAVAATK